jgi:hypothetical protein
MQSRREPAAIERENGQQYAIHGVGFTRTALDTDDGEVSDIVFAASALA